MQPSPATTESPVVSCRQYGTPPCPATTSTQDWRSLLAAYGWREIQGPGLAYKSLFFANESVASPISLVTWVYGFRSCTAVPRVRIRTSGLWSQRRLSQSSGRRNLQFRGSTSQVGAHHLVAYALLGGAVTRAGKQWLQLISREPPGCVGSNLPTIASLLSVVNFEDTEQIRTAQSAAGSYSENGRGGGIETRDHSPDSALPKLRYSRDW